MSRPRPTRKAPDRSGRDLFARYPPRPQTAPTEDVNPVWLLRGVLAVVGLAFVCTYGTLCLLVDQGQWQLLLHPTTRAAALPGEPVRFGAAGTGQPELTGLWWPASGSTPTTPTLLYLPGATGQLADDDPALAELHTLPVNIFAFDYRGYGQSPSGQHPSEARMTADTESALAYLLDTRHIPSATVVPYGTGLGASLAASLAARHGELPAVVLEQPVAHASDIELKDPRVRWVPLRLFLHERFELEPTLATLRTPKLLLTAGPGFPESIPARPAVAPERLREPSMTVHLPPWNAAGPRDRAAYRASILRFLGEYLPGMPGTGPTS